MNPHKSLWQRNYNQWIKKYKSLFTQNQNYKDGREILNKYYKSSLIELNSVFERFQLAQVDEESYDLLKELNLMMKEMDSIRLIKKALAPYQANKILDNVLALADIGMQQTMAIPEINDEFDHLPESFQFQIQPLDDQEKLSLPFSTKMTQYKNEIGSAIWNFNQEFTQIETIKLFWQNTKF